MSRLMKRIEKLEQESGIGKGHALWVDCAIDGGLIHEGQFYESCSALLHALKYEQGDEVQVVSWQATQTAAELLEEAKKTAALAEAKKITVIPVPPKVEHRQQDAIGPQYASGPQGVSGDDDCCDLRPSGGYAIGRFRPLFPLWY